MGKNLFTRNLYSPISSPISSQAPVPASKTVFLTIINYPVNNHHRHQNQNQCKTQVLQHQTYQLLL